MGKTIIQPIGPLYGEAVNGTVYGRPNGSIYTPSTNKIEIKLATGCNYLRKVYPANFRVTLSNGTRPNDALTIIAESQDNAAYISYAIYTDATAETVLSEGDVQGIRELVAGRFYYDGEQGGFLFSKNIEITVGETYYLMATLYASTGVAVAVSDIYPLEAIS